MSKKHKQHRHQNQGRTGAVMNPTALESNDAKGGKKSRTRGVALLAALVVIAAVVAYALNAPKGTPSESGPVAGSNPPLPTAFAPPQQPPSAPASTVSTNVSGARIQFATPTYDFGKINGGEVVKYAYVFTNVGNALLQISNVQASCGCTTAGDWSRQVEPRKTGSIPIVFTSHNFSGPVSKSITVTCNDKRQPVVGLQIKGTIWWPIEVTPKVAILSITAESPSNSTIVRITNHVDQPLVLSRPISNHPAFGVELQTNQPGKEFALIVSTAPPAPTSNVFGQITLNTSSTNMPVINVTVWANVQPVLMVMPTQINLPSAPLTNAIVSTISIRNNGTNALVLSDPSVNAKGVGVHLSELQPGRFFALAASFPAGFEIAPGEKVELNVKSNHPKLPLIQVPVLQPPRPAPVAVPGPGQPGTAADEHRPAQIGAKAEK